MSAEVKGNTTEEQVRGFGKLPLVIIIVGVITIGVLGGVMLYRNKHIEDLKAVAPAVEEEYKATDDVVTYKIGDFEYKFEELATAVKEPTLATKMVLHKDGNCDYSDVYITFGTTDSDTVEKKMQGGMETIVIGRDDNTNTESVDSTNTESGDSSVGE